jgi:hypothetical protein
MRDESKHRHPLIHLSSSSFIKAGERGNLENSALAKNRVGKISRLC